METLDKCSTDVFTVLQERHTATGPAAIAPAGAAVTAPRPSLKPSASELKPSTLCHDSSTSIFRAWKKRFKAYYDASGTNHLPCLQQQAYLSNCLDDALHARIDREATATTPIYSPIVRLFTCIKILDAAFLETYPLHARRKQFFKAKEKEGQSPLDFREELLSHIDKADGINISVNDLVCMMLQIGLSDQGLQRELGSIRDPTLQLFTEKIEDYEEGLKTTGSSVFANIATRGSAPRRPANQGIHNSSSNPTHGRGEQSRRTALRGKCFRCARNDHMIPNCSYPETVKCNSCGLTGHIAPAR